MFSIYNGSVNHIHQSHLPNPHTAISLFDFLLLLPHSHTTHSLPQAVLHHFEMFASLQVPHKLAKHLHSSSNYSPPLQTPQPSKYHPTILLL